MRERVVGEVKVPVSAKDKQLIEDILETAPFKHSILLNLALRIGLKTIQQDPSVLMPYLAKAAPAPE